MKMCVTALAIMAGAASANAAVSLANWTFESSIPTTAGPFAAELGANAGSSFASGFHAAASTYSNPVGNGSNESFSSTAWAIGDYYQFTTSATGYQSITFQWDHASSNTGPRDFNLLLSINGGAYNIVGSASVLANASPNPVWTSGSSSAIYTITLPAGGGANNATSLSFRIQQSTNIAANGGTVASGGTSRVDNVIISGDLVPAPSALALLGLGGLIAGRRRR